MTLYYLDSSIVHDADYDYSSDKGKPRPHQVVNKDNSNTEWINFFNTFYVKKNNDNVHVFDYIVYRNVDSKDNFRLLYLGCWAFSNACTNRQLKHFALELDTFVIVQIFITYITESYLPDVTDEEFAESTKFQEVSFFHYFYCLLIHLLYTGYYKSG